MKFCKIKNENNLAQRKFPGKASTSIDQVQKPKFSKVKTTMNNINKL